MEVGDINGVEKVEAFADSKKAIVKFDEPATEKEIKQVLAEINYPAKEI
jgi:copper chaperone CopZ